MTTKDRWFAFARCHEGLVFCCIFSIAGLVFMIGPFIAGYFFALWYGPIW